MLSSLPGLAPRDSYTLWYTSSYSTPTTSLSNPDTSSSNPLTLGSSAPDGPANNGLAGANRRVSAAMLQRSPLAQLRADEQYMERRKANVKNYGNSWLKPPGVMKTLFQLQEEEREMREHEEALRRERLVQELAEAEAEAAGMEGQPGEGEDELGMEARDLDDDIPDADGLGGGLDMDDSDDSDSESDDHEDADASIPVPRVPEQAYREALLGQMDGGLSDDEEDTVPQMREMMRAQIMTEEDMLQQDGNDDLGMSNNLSDAPEAPEWGSEGDLDMDMDADLDEEVPSAEELGEYEHTDTDESLESSDEDEDEDASTAGDVGSQPRSNQAESQPGQRFGSSAARNDETQQSIDLGMDDITQSSFMGSSPVLRRGRGRG